MYKKDLSGQKFGRLKVICYSGEELQGSSLWTCICDCGKTIQKTSRVLTSGNTRSCGCMLDDFRRSPKFERRIRDGRETPSGKVIYRRWIGMRNRCNNPNDPSYIRYGGRGICVCEEWEDNFPAFLQWSYANGWAKDLSLDRIDNDGPYSPENCRWTSNIIQSNNKRNNHYLDWHGETKSVSDWGREVGIQPATIIGRLKRGWSVEDALTISPVGNHRKV